MSVRNHSALVVILAVRALTGHLPFTPKGYSRRESKVLIAKSMVELLGQLSGTAWAGRLETQTQSVSELAAVDAGSNRITQGKCYHSSFAELV